MQGDKGQHYLRNELTLCIDVLIRIRANQQEEPRATTNFQREENQDERGQPVGAKKLSHTDRGNKIKSTTNRRRRLYTGKSATSSLVKKGNNISFATPRRKAPPHADPTIRLAKAHQERDPTPKSNHRESWQGQARL